jgi:hypothetical protein
MKYQYHLHNHPQEGEEYKHEFGKTNLGIDGGTDLAYLLTQCFNGYFTLVESPGDACVFDEYGIPRGDNLVSVGVSITFDQWYYVTVQSGSNELEQIELSFDDLNDALRSISGIEGMILHYLEIDRLLLKTNDLYKELYKKAKEAQGG